MKRVSWLMVGTLLCGAMLAYFGSAAANSVHAQEGVGAMIYSDAEDYAPGEIALITGIGFWPHELVDVSIAIDDPLTGEHVADYEFTAIETDASGGFVLAYEIPEEALNTLLTVTAMGMDSQLVATTSFTDNHGTHNFRFATVGLPAGINLSINGSRRNPGHNVANFTVNFVSPGPSVNTGAQAGGGVSTVSYAGFPLSVPGIGGDFELQSTSPASGFATGASGATTTVTATYSFVPNVQCPVNNAPTISADDLNLGQIVGCLVGSSFETTQPLSADDFNWTAADADGDPISVSLNVTEVTLVGPGFAEATVTLTATDDPSARNVAGCPTLASMSGSVDVKVTAQVIYSFGGFGSPLSKSLCTIVKKGSTVPVKFQISDCFGTPITGGVHSIAVTYNAGTAPNGDATVADSGSSNDNGVLFRWADPNWIFNLSTKPTSYQVGYTYRIRAMLDDGTDRDIYISIKK